MRRPVDHWVALVELGCAVVVLVYTALLAAQGRSVVPLVFGAVVAAGLVLMSLRSRRRAAQQTPPAAATPSTAATPPSATPPWAAGPSADDVPRPVPVLSPEGERELARVVGVLGGHGVFAPRTPDPADLRAPVADHGEPVTAYAALSALHEADYYVAGFDRSDYDANLAFHDSHVEQFGDTLRDQAADLARLAALPDLSVVVLADDGPVRLRLTVGDRTQVLEYVGAATYLSTVLHVAVARIARGRRTGRRLAWLWSDQGVWLTGLPDGTVDRLNADLGPAAGEGWEWVDEQEPVAAGAV